jgi:hypothetical protein
MASEGGELAHEAKVWVFESQSVFSRKSDGGDVRESAKSRISALKYARRRCRGSGDG